MQLKFALLRKETSWSYLKTALQNAQLELSLAMREQPMEEKKAFLSDKDRYELMVEKNPSLEKLRKALANPEFRLKVSMKKTVSKKRRPTAHVQVDLKRARS